ncbi:MAG TPA: DUF938 domain-containing protein [Enhygromyxa sp.]|nr:DUF938 domain-containing protein [Enhygromyxa sp.]
MSDDPRLDYPATRRNREAILEVLREVLPASGTVLELASGSGQHVAHFAAALPQLRWQPTDLDAELFASIEAWTEGLANVAKPIALDVTASQWPIERCNAVTCANMIHIAPWDACLGLLDGVTRILESDGPLVLYGPFKRNGVHTAPSNEAFDQSLRARDPRWGVRDLDEVAKEANDRGFALDRVFDMPANNLTVVFRRRTE